MHWTTIVSIVCWAIGGGIVLLFAIPAFIGNIQLQRAYRRYEQKDARGLYTLITNGGAADEAFRLLCAMAPNKDSYYTERERAGDIGALLAQLSTHALYGKAALMEFNKLAACFPEAVSKAVPPHHQSDAIRQIIDASLKQEEKRQDRLWEEKCAAERARHTRLYVSASQTPDALTGYLLVTLRVNASWEAISAIQSQSLGDTVVAVAHFFPTQAHTFKLCDLVEMQSRPEQHRSFRFGSSGAAASFVADLQKGIDQINERIGTKTTTTS